MKSKTILIFGISSFLGSNLAHRLKKEYRVIGTYFNTPVDVEGILTLKCDVNNKELVQKIVLIFQPDVTVYAIGLNDLVACDEYPKVADALNTAGVFNVSQASERYGSKFVYFSSCFIFPGENIYYRESDTPMPMTTYGNTVASSEFYIQKSCLNYLIFRCSPIFGRSYNCNDLKWMEVLERCSYEGKRVICDTKVYTGFVDVWTVAELFVLAIKNNITNRLFQVSTKDVMNRYEFASKYFEVFGGNQSLLAKGDWSFPRMKNLISLHGLEDELYFKLSPFNIESEFDVEMPTIEQSLVITRQMLSGGKNLKKKDKGSGVSFI